MGKMDSAGLGMVLSATDSGDTLVVDKLHVAGPAFQSGLICKFAPPHANQQPTRFANVLSASFHLMILIPVLLCGWTDKHDTLVAVDGRKVGGGLP
jgi:hypothetical protein